MTNTLKPVVGSWYRRVDKGGVATAEQPEDWMGPYDDIQPDDLGYSDMGPETDADQALGEDAPLQPADMGGKGPPEDI